MKRWDFALVALASIFFGIGCGGGVYQTGIPAATYTPTGSLSNDLQCAVNSYMAKYLSFCYWSASSIKKCPDGYQEAGRYDAKTPPENDLNKGKYEGEGTGYCFMDFAEKVDRTWITCQAQVWKPICPYTCQTYHQDTKECTGEAQNTCPDKCAALNTVK